MYHWTNIPPLNNIPYRGSQTEELDLMWTNIKSLITQVLALHERLSRLEQKPTENHELNLKQHKETIDGTAGLSTRGGKRGKKVAAKRKKKSLSPSGNGRGKKPDDSGDSEKPVRKKRGRPPLNRVPSK